MSNTAVPGLNSFDPQTTQEPLAVAPGLAGLGAAIGTALSNTARIGRNEAAQAQMRQLQQLALQAQKTQVGTQLFAQIGNDLSSNPALAGDQQRIKRAKDIAKQTGLQVPVKIDPTSGLEVLDIDLLVPKPDVATLAPDKRFELYQKLIAMPPEDRVAFVGQNGVRNVPPEWLTAKQYTPLSTGGTTEVVKSLIGPDGAVAQFKAGKLDPIAFSANIAAIHSLDPSIDVSQYETPEFLQSGVSQWAQTQMDWLKTRGIVLKDDAATRARMEQDRQKEIVLRATMNQQQLALRDREFQQRQAQLWQTHIDNLSVAQSRLQNQADALNSLIQNRQFMQGISTVNALYKPIGDLRTQFDAANAALTSVSRAIATNSQNGNPPSKELQTQYDSLTKLVGETEVQLKYYESAVRDASNSAASGVAGQPVLGIPGTQRTQPNPNHPPGESGGIPPGAMKNTSRSGKPIYSTDGGATWHYAQ